MTSIPTGIPVADARQIDTSKLKNAGIRELTGEEYRKFIDDMEKRLGVSHQTRPDTSNHPAYQADAAVDQAAMRKDPLYLLLQKTKQIESQFRAQQIAQEPEADDAKGAGPADAGAPTDGEAGAVEDGKSDAVRAFLEYMAKTPEERYFEAFLKSKGMTEEQFQALPPEEKQALMKEFEDYVKQHVEDASAERIARAAGAGLF